VAQSAQPTRGTKNAEKWFRADLAAAGFTEAQAKSLKLTAVQNLTYQNPEQALRLMGEIEVEPKMRENILRNLFGYGHDAAKNEQLLALLANDEELPRSGSRDRATVAAPKRSRPRLQRSGWSRPKTTIPPREAATAT
jgi:hypothetical protein